MLYSLLNFSFRLDLFHTILKNTCNAAKTSTSFTRSKHIEDQNTHKAKLESLFLLWSFVQNKQDGRWKT